VAEARSDKIAGRAFVFLENISKRINGRRNTMKKLIAGLLITLVAAAAAQTVEHTFTRADVPQYGQVRLANVDFSTTQNIDVSLPANLRYVFGAGFIRSASVTSLSAGAVVTLSEVTSAGAAVQTLLPAVTLSASSVTGSLEDLIPAASTVGGIDFAYLVNPAAATTADAFTTVTNLVAATNAVTIAAASITDPGTPRNVVLVVTEDGATQTNLTGSVTINGTDWAGLAISETLTMTTTTTETLTGSKAFATITSVVYQFDNGEEADTLAMGYGVKLGLPVDTRNQQLVAIRRLSVGGTAEAAAATDTANGTFTATTAPNATNDYEVFYSYKGAARPNVIDGANRLRIAITGSTATNDVKDVVLNLYAF
jgi:hypothetical protein